MEDLWTVFCGESDCGGVSCGSGFVSITNPSSCINHVFVICVDVLLILMFLVNLVTKSSSRTIWFRNRSQRFYPLELVSAIFNGCLGLVYLGLGIWIVEEKLRNAETILPLHWWLVVLLQGFTWLFLGLTVSLRGRQLPKSFVRLWSIVACLFAGILCVLSLVIASAGEEVSVKMILDVLSLPGSVLLLLCAYKEYKFEENGQIINGASLYTPLSGEENGNSKISSDSNVTPFAKAGFFSRMSFWWLNPLMKKGKEKTLEDEDIPRLREADPITLKFEEVVYRVKLEQMGFCWGGASREKTILNGITGMVCPGEILAMLGPSGSGKTTLLTALGGRLNGKLSGKITYNGHPFTSSIKRRTGFVAQNDVLYQHLTVTETLVFTALLRLPDTLTREQKIEHAQHVINDLGLTRCSNSMIGGPLVRGISGGEKKRVSIGQEMLVNPSLLLLDEPTSGLDSTTAQRILTTIKHLASGGRTVVITIHQPSSRLYHMFDKVVLISEGCPIYYGPASTAMDYFSSIGFFTSVTVNPADLLLDLANGIAPDSNQMTDHTHVGKEQQEQKLVREVLMSAYDKNIATRLKAELCGGLDVNNYGYASSTRHAMKPEQLGTSWWQQFKVLLKRGLKERRYEAFNRLRIFQVISVAVLAGLLWWHSPASHIQDRVALLFFFSVFWGFFPLYNAVFTFPQERSMLIKERSSGMYRLSSYFLARTAGDLPMELALPTAFVFIIYWMTGLKPDPISFILSLLVVLYSVLVSQSLGLAFGAILMDVKQATTLASVTTLVFLMAGGYYIQQIPPFIIWLKYLSYSFYCYKLLLGIQYTENDIYECSKGEFCRVVDFPAIKSIGLNHLWIDVCIMGLMLVGYRLVAYMALHRVQIRK